MFTTDGFVLEQTRPRTNMFAFLLLNIRDIVKSFKTHFVLTVIKTVLAFKGLQSATKHWPMWC